MSAGVTVSLAKAFNGQRETGGRLLQNKGSKTERFSIFSKTGRKKEKRKLVGFGDEGRWLESSITLPKSSRTLWVLKVGKKKKKRNRKKPSPGDMDQGRPDEGKSAARERKKKRSIKK